MHQTGLGRVRPRPKPARVAREEPSSSRAALHDAAWDFADAPSRETGVLRGASFGRGRLAAVLPSSLGESRSRGDRARPPRDGRVAQRGSPAPRSEEDQIRQIDSSSAAASPRRAREACFERIVCSTADAFERVVALSAVAVRCVFSPRSFAFLPRRVESDCENFRSSLWGFRSLAQLRFFEIVPLTAVRSRHTITAAWRRPFSPLPIDRLASRSRRRGARTARGTKLRVVWVRHIRIVRAMSSDSSGKRGREAVDLPSVRRGARAPTITGSWCKQRGST